MAFLGGMGGVGGAGIGDGLIRIGAVTNGLRGAVRGAVNDARSELNAGAKRIEGTGQNWNRAFGIVGAAAKAAFAGAALAIFGAVGASIAFEKAWAGVRKTVDATPARLEKLRSQFRELAKEIPISVIELAKIGETAGALGIATDSIAAFTKVTAELGSTTNVSSDQAATALGQLSNVLHLTEKDYEKFGSTLVDLGNKGASTESQILDIASRAGSAGKLIGLSTPDILAWGSAVASLGIETEAGGSALQFFFLQASKVVNEVTKTGVPSARQLAEAQMKVRLATEALAKAQGKGVPSSRAIAEAQQRVAIATQTLGKAQAKYGGASIQAQRASLALAHAQDALAKAQHGSGGSAAAAQRAELSLMKAQDALNKLTGKGSDALNIMAKTAGMSADAFKKLYGQDATKALAAFLTGLGKLPAGAQQAVLATLKLNNIRVIRAILGLANNADELNRQLSIGEKAWEDNTALATAAGKRYETTAAQLSILKNIIFDLFISLGDNLLPVVKFVVKVFREDIPKAAAFLSNLLQTIWNSSLGPAVGAMLDGFRTLATGVAGIFDFGGDQKTKGNGLATIITGIGNVAAQAAKFVGGLASALGELLKNPVIRGLAQIGVILGGIALALSAGAAAAGRLSGAARGIASRLTFGRFGGGNAAATPLDGSAKALTGSATALKEAAGALKRGALADPYNKLGKLDATGYPKLKYVKDSGPVTRATPAFGRQADMLRHQFSQLSPAEQAAMTRAAQPWAAEVKTSTLNAIGTNLRSGLGKIKGALSGALSFVGGAFWPAVIADLGIEFLKGPLGDFISTNTQFKRAGEQIKNDFFGGLVSLVQSWSIGSDAFVGHNSTMTIGKMTFNTMSLAKLGVTSATFDKLEAPEGTIEHAQGVSAAAATIAATNFARAAGENVNDWWKRVKAALPEETLKAASQFIIQGGRGAGYVKDAAGLEAFIRRATSQQLSDLQTQANTAYVDALADTLKAHGFSAGQIGRLTTAQLASLGSLVKADAQDQYGFVTEFMTNTYLGAIDQKSKSQVALSAEMQARVSAFKTAFGKNWEGMLSKFAFGPAPKSTKANAAIVAKLQKLLGDDWKTILQTTIRGLRPAPKSAIGSNFGLNLATLHTDEKGVESAMTDYLNKIPTDVQAAVTAFAAQAQRIDPTILAKLTKKFGADWIVAMRNGTGAITNKPVDKSIVAEMVKRFGPNWREALQGFGQLLFAKEGGADSLALKKALAGAISAQIKGLTSADLTPTDGKKPTAADATADRKAVQKYISSTIGQAALAAAASPDAETAKKGFQDLGTALAKSIPDESARNRFIGTLVALQKAAATPDLPRLEAFLAGIAPHASDAATDLGHASNALDLLAAAARRFISATGGNPGGGTSGNTRQTGGKVAAATGMVFDTHGETSMTVGEAGREHVAVLRNFKTIALPKAPAAQSLVHDIVGGLRRVANAPAGALLSAGSTGGPRVQLNADKLQLFSDGDRRSLDAQLGFLAPDGR